MRGLARHTTTKRVLSGIGLRGAYHAAGALDVLRLGILLPSAGRWRDGLAQWSGSRCDPAAASAGVFLGRGYIDPGLAMPVMLGVLLGSFLGTCVLVAARVSVLRLVFGVVILALGIEMIYKGLTGAL